MQQHFKSFVVGSSLAATIWPLAGLSIASRDKPLDLLDWRATFLILPLAFGLANAATVAASGQPSRRRFALFGAALGLALASTGTFVFHVPELVYDLQGHRRYVALIGGPIFYGAVWSLVLFPLDRLFGLIDTNPKGA